MKALLWFLVPLALVVVAIIAIAPRITTTPSPVHAVNVYLDGIIHSDFRQACSVIVAPRAFPRQADCEAYFVQQTAFYGSTPYKVEPHSDVIWKQTYQGRTVTLAIVLFADPSGKRVLTARLRLTKRGWLLTGVSA